MNTFRDVTDNMTDKQVREAVNECLEDERANDGIIRSKWVRHIAEEYGRISQTSSPSMFLFNATVAIYKEGCKRFIK